MFPVGHFLVAFVPVCAYVLVRDRALPTPQLTFVVFVGSQFPDLIDKPLFLESLVTTSGRMGAHSLPIAIPIVAAAVWYAVHTDRPRAGAGFAFAYGTHILGDYYPFLLDPNRPVPSVLFWPLTDPPLEPPFPSWAGPELVFVHLWTVFSVVVLLVAGGVLLYDIYTQSTLG